jgi:hypothetical protein
MMEVFWALDRQILRVVFFLFVFNSAGLTAADAVAITQLFEY